MHTVTKYIFTDDIPLSFCKRRRHNTSARSKCCSRSGGKNGVSCRIHTVKIFAVNTLFFCVSIYFDMLSVQHSSKKEPNNFFKHFWWFPRGIDDIQNG